MKACILAILWILAAFTILGPASDNLLAETPNPKKLVIYTVSADRKVFDPGEQPLRIRYRLSADAGVEVIIRNRRGEVVRSLRSGEPGQSGFNTIVWDGKSISGNVLPPGVYTYELRAESPTTGEIAEHAVTGTQGAGVTVRGFDWNDRGEITYDLPEAAEVSVRVGIKEGGPLLRTLLRRQPQPEGRHTLRWDGWDNSRVVNVLGRDDLLVSVQAYSLPANCLILKGDSGSVEPLEPGFEFEILDRFNLPEDSLPEVKDVLSMEVTLDRSDEKEVLEGSFEIMFFVDFHFLYEAEEPKTSPYAYKWDISGLAPGEHLLTVNILDLDDRAISSRSKKITVRE
jgi:hypothetical protein